MRFKCTRVVVAVVLLMVSIPGAAAAGAPVVIGPRQGGAVLLPDGTLKRFVPKGGKNYSQISTDSGQTWGESRFEYEGPPANLPLLDMDGEYHLFPMIARSEGDGTRREIAVNYFIDIWHVRTSGGGTRWEAPRVIFAGYVGSLNCVAQLSNGRIIVPFGEWIGGRPQAPPAGANVVTCVYSDDGGATWEKSPAQLTAPCYTDFNGSAYGACEPVIMEFKDGRVYMLARTETGRLYESYSSDGVHWDELTPSRFLGTDAPAAFLRLPDGRILLAYNACEKPPRVGRDGVYGGRDALHAAISDDETVTWRGFREIYRDPTRNESPQKSGDRGTAYPMPYLAPEGQVLVMAGQGRSGATVLFHPDWLLATEQRDDFSRGLDGWSVFKHFGPAERWWQDRTQGAELTDHPDTPGAKVLWVRRPDEKPGDGAVWNFPMGRSGTLGLRVLPRDGFGGAAISLLDRFFNPADPEGDAEAVFKLEVQPDGHVSIANVVQAGTWHDLQFQWDIDRRVCVVSLDGEPKVYLKQSYRDPIGINYVRIRSTADQVDTGGLMVASVYVQVVP